MRRNWEEEKKRGLFLAACVTFERVQNGGSGSSLGVWERRLKACFVCTLNQGAFGSNLDGDSVRELF